MSVIVSYGKGKAVCVHTIMAYGNESTAVLILNSTCCMPGEAALSTIE